MHMGGGVWGFRPPAAPPFSVLRSSTNLTCHSIKVGGPMGGPEKSPKTPSKRELATSNGFIGHSTRLYFEGSCAAEFVQLGCKPSE